MAFKTLPINIQNLYIENFNFLFKLSLILIFLFVSIMIINNFKPKTSKYLMVSKIRLTYFIMAWVIILTFPFQLGFLSPNVSVSAILNPMITFYTVNFIVLGLVLTLNILWHGSGFITELFVNEQNKDLVNNPLKSDLKKYLK